VKWVSRAAGLIMVAVVGLAVVRATSENTCIARGEHAMFAVLAGLLCGVWLDDPADSSRRRVLEFLAVFYVLGGVVLGLTLGLNKTACG
jgi:hypothetical protein